MSSASFSRNPGPSHPVAGARRARTASEQTPVRASPASPPKRLRHGVMPPEAPRKAKVDPYKLKKNDIPDGVKGFKAALELHIRILIGACSNAVIPQPPTAHDICTFEQRFNGADQVEHMLRNTARNYVVVDDQIRKSHRELRAQCASEHGGTIARSVSRVPDNIIRLIFGAVHEFGLAAWRPELLTGTPTSIYHLSLEAIAIWTFEQALASFGYRFLSPNVSLINNTALIKKIYLNFVWSYLRGLVLKEHKEPGSVARGLEANKAYKGRDELNEKRVKFLRDNGFPERVVRLCSENECASDHERSSDGTAFLIMRKRARNNHVTDFYRWIDNNLVSGVTPLLRGQRIRRLQTATLPRVPHPENKETMISIRLPVNATLDWFDPNYFNQLDMRFRALYVDAPVALPLHEDCHGDPRNADWRTMTDEEFMLAYEARVCARYNLPTPEEIEALENGEGTDIQNSESAPSTATTPTPQPAPAPAPFPAPGPTAVIRLALPAPPTAGPSHTQTPDAQDGEMEDEDDV